MPTAIFNSDYKKAAHALGSYLGDIEAQVAAAIAVERERCAMICESHAVHYIGMKPIRLAPSMTGEPVGRLFAAAIRRAE